jgi:hypothetical protein
MDIAQYNKAIKLMETDVLIHLATLKYLTLYRKNADVNVVEDNSGWAVLSSFPTSILSFDKETYPEAKVALFVNGTSEKLKRYLLYSLTDNNYVLRLNEPLDLAMLRNRYQVTRGFVYNSYTCSKLSTPIPDTVLRAQKTLTEEAVKLFSLNGHDEADLKKYFENGAVWFGVINNNKLKSAGFVFQDYDNVREIGGVHTLESERRKGYAGTVVYSAVKYLLDNKLIPRYCTEEKNHSSIRLAESLGMKQFLRIEHFLLSPK